MYKNSKTRIIIRAYAINSTLVPLDRGENNQFCSGQF